MKEVHLLFPALLPARTTGCWGCSKLTKKKKRQVEVNYCFLVRLLAHYLIQLFVSSSECVSVVVGRVAALYLFVLHLVPLAPQHVQLLNVSPTVCSATLPVGLAYSACVVCRRTQAVNVWLVFTTPSSYYVSVCCSPWRQTASRCILYSSTC